MPGGGGGGSTSVIAWLHQLCARIGTRNMNSPRISFGDKFRIRSEKATESKAVAGKTGIVHGQTTPSVTGVEVIGFATEDYAIAVMVEGHYEALWFAESLLEFVDHQPGTTIDVAGRRLIRDERGEWHEPKPS